jgi:hypothetical protein
MPAGQFLITQFLGVFYQQSNYWYLGVLFACLAVYGIFYADYYGTSVKNKTVSRTPVSKLLLLWTVSELTYYVFSLIRPADAWFNLGYVLYFQQARIVGYIGVFSLGIHAWKNRWFTKSGWLPEIVSWGIIAAVSSVSLLLWKFTYAHLLDPITNAVCDAVLYNATALSATFFLCAFFLKMQETFRAAATFFAPHTYGIYWLQQVALMPFLWIIRLFDLPIALKFVISIPFNIAICFVISKYLLKRSPFF